MNTQSDPNYRLKQPLIVKWRKVEDGTPGPCPRPRHGHRGVAIKDLMLVFGGGNEGIVDELHVYDVGKNKWFVPVVRGNIPRGFAAYGMVTDQGKVFIFGGMVEYGKYSNDMYELQTTRWEWRQLRVRPPQDGTPGPCPRLGHSFTLGTNHYAYVFGGLANDSEDPKVNVPHYLNDLYIINLGSLSNNLWWEAPQIQGLAPPPRESHTAVHFITQTGKEQLIIYGGMDGRRMNDVWILDLYNLTWSNPVPNGIAPLPRSLHTSNVVGNRMFAFGGWVPIQPQEKEEHPDKEWKCSNTLAVLNLNSLTWEQPAEPTTDPNGNEPGARAGHSGVVINKRIYIWSGRDGYKKTWSSQVCCNDLWEMEVEPPTAPNGIQLVRASVNSLEILWTPVPNADHYILQLQKVEQQSQEEQKGIQGRRMVRGIGAQPQQQSPTVRMIRPSPPNYRQQRSVMMVQQRPQGLTSSYPTTIRASTPNESGLGVSPPSTRTIIVPVQKTGQGQVISTTEQSTQPPHKVMILQQPAPNFQQSQQAGFEAIPPNSSAYIRSPPATAKTTYTAPAAPPIDQTMPTNILDEALNEAESFVGEQLQQQQKQMQQEHIDKDATEESKASNDHNSAEQENAESKSDLEEKPTSDSSVKRDEDAAKPDKNDDVKTDSEQLPLEEMRAMSDDSKDMKDDKESALEQDQNEFQPLADDATQETEQPQQSYQEKNVSATTEPTTSQTAETNTNGANNGQTSSQFDVPVSELPPPESEEHHIDKQLSEVQPMVGAINGGSLYRPQQLLDQPSHPQQTQQHEQPTNQYLSFSTIPATADQWFNVATVNENKFTITHYYTTAESVEKTMPLESGVFYRFRVCAVNSIGRSKWSPVNSFKTCVPGYPGAPSSIKITKGADGAHISWEPPQTTNGDIIEYSVYLAMRSASLAQPAFVPVHIGPTPNCIVNHQHLQLAHIDANPKPAIIFRIAARNEKGYGPATQVRWLQDQRPIAMMPPLQPPTMAGQTHTGKRAYPYHYQSPPMGPTVSTGAGGYYGQTSGPPRYVVQTSGGPMLTHHQEGAPVRPRSQQQIRQVRQMTPPTSSPSLGIQQQASTSVVGSYTTGSPQRAVLQPQRQSHSASPQHHIQQSNIFEGGQSATSPQQQVNSGMTVREYLTGGSGGKRLRLE